MESLKILQIAIKERILVIPFDFQSDGAVVGSSHMVDFMRDSGPLYIVDGFPDDDVSLDPAPICQGPSEPLRRAGLASPTLYQLHIGDPHIQQSIAQFAKRLGKIVDENGQGMVLGLNVEPYPFEIG